jgi:ribose transport system permease protein
MSSVEKQAVTGRAAAEIEDPAAASDHEDAGQLKGFLTSQPFWMTVALAILFMTFSAVSPKDFPTWPNIKNILYDGSTLLLLSVGMTYVIITGGIDLSIGGILVCAQVVAALLMISIGDDSLATVALGLVVAVSIGLLCGLINGLLISKAKIPPLIATLGMAGVTTGISLVLTGGLNLSGIPGKLSALGMVELFGVPALVLVTLAVAVVGGFILALTRFGAYTVAIGSSPTAAQRVGIPLQSHLSKVYMLSGGLAGLAAFLELARFSTTTVTGHATDSLQTIAAVVLGGTSLFGGSGSIFGTIIGVLIPAILQNGFIIAGLQSFWQQIAIGIVLVVAVYFDQIRRGRSR